MSMVWVILSAAGKITALAAASLALDLMLSRINTGRERALVEKEIF